MSPVQGTNARSSAPRRLLASGLLATFGASLLAVAWFEFATTRSPPDSAPLPESPPHLLIEQVDALTTETSGRIYRRLRADRMLRVAPGAMSLFVRPRLTVFPATGPAWYFEAERGEVSPDGENIYLPGPVRGRRDAAEPLEIDSRDLRITATDNYGESDEPATIRGTSFEVRGTGMKIWLAEGRIELLEDASGVVQPR